MQPPSRVRLLCVVSGDPIPKERPRWNGRMTYTPARTRAREQAIATGVQPFIRESGHAEHYRVELRFYRKTKRSVDLDNLQKLVMDALTAGGVWENDNQVTKMCGEMQWSDPNPRTVIAVYAL